MAAIANDWLSHGTVECTDMAATRAFLEDFLGLDVHRPFREAQYMYKGGPWTVVCVCVEGGETKDQPTDNRFKLVVDDAAEVRRAHDAAMARKGDYGVRAVTALSDGDDPSFLVQDLDHNWWEITARGQAYYDALFEKGDIAA